jgi:hypothetical protein
MLSLAHGPKPLHTFIRETFTLLLEQAIALEFAKFAQIS